MQQSGIVTFFVQKTGQKDDIIGIYKHDSSLFRVVYSPNDIKGKYIFYMTRDKVLDYVSTMLDTLYEDAHPFTYFQVMTASAPSILSNIADLSESRNNILDIVSMTLTASPERV